jgi:hypothetical protein
MKNSAANSARYRAKDVEAYRERKREYARTPEQRAVRTAYMRVWRDKNREKHNAWSREYHQKNKEKVRASNRRQNLARYGLTEKEWTTKLRMQRNRCGLCREPFKSQRTTHVDHCHKTGKIRMLLCSRCNGALGWFEKYREKIVKYHEKEW